MTNKKDDKSSWVIGGTTLIGLGVGFLLLFLQSSGLLFVASLLIGIGLGLVIAPMITRKAGVQTDLTQDPTPTLGTCVEGRAKDNPSHHE